MQIYLVGGAVRDNLLGLTPKERDWVVVGSTEQAMLDAGYQKVGKDFPVFLHPDTKEEYALARTEKKQGTGYTGFEVHADSHVSLEDDLKRRDLTINAIAQKTNGELIDPYHGIQDIANRSLKHVSEAFSEDPLRVLRIARFKAKLHHLGFTIDDKTFALIKTMSKSGELTTLSPERIWQEIKRALDETSPDQFVQTLYQCHALESLVPELDKRFHQADNIKGVGHNIGQRTLFALQYAARHNFTTTVRFAILLHAVGEANTPKSLDTKRINKHHNQTLQAVFKRLKVPNEFAELATITGNFLHFAIKADKTKPDGILDLLEHCDAWRKPERFIAFLQACESLTASDENRPHNYINALTFLRTTLNACLTIDTKEFLDAGLTGKAIGESVRNARKIIIANLLQQFKR